MEEPTADKPRNPSIRLNGDKRSLRNAASVDTVEAFTDRAVERLANLAETCALDVADDGRHKMREVGERIGASRFWAIQVARSGRRKMVAELARVGVHKRDTQD